jgi:hypothetical protein
VLALSPSSTDRENSFKIDTPAPVMHVSHSGDLDYPNSERSNYPTTGSSYSSFFSSALTSALSLSTSSSCPQRQCMFDCGQ